MYMCVCVCVCVKYIWAFERGEGGFRRKVGVFSVLTTFLKNIVLEEGSVFEI